MNPEKAVTVGGHIRVLIIPGNDPVGDWMASVLQAEPDILLLGVARGPGGAADSIENLAPDVVLVDVASGILEHKALLDRLAAPGSPCGVIVVAMSNEVHLVQQAMGVIRAAAQSFLLKPFGETDLLSTVRQMYEKVQDIKARMDKGRAPQPAIPAREQRERSPIVGVFSPKGGVGCTTVAVNLAVALMEATGQESIVVDADLRFGDVDTALNVASNTSLSTVVSQLDDLEDFQLAQSLVQHKSRIHVLAAPDNLDAADRIDPEDIKRLLYRLAELGKGYVVVDTWSALNDTTLSILDACDHLVVLTTPQVTALRDVYRFLEVLGPLGYDSDKVWLVLNHCYLPGEVKLKDLERALGRPIAQTIEYAPGPVLNSLNRGVPLVQAYPAAPAAANIVQLARQLVAAQKAAEDEVAVGARGGSQEKPRKRRLFSTRIAFGSEVNR